MRDETLSTTIASDHPFSPEEQQLLRSLAGLIVPASAEHAVPGADEEPIISNVPTYICDRPEDLKYVREHIQNLVVKPVDMSGGYGVCICDQMSKEEVAGLLAKIEANPRDFIAQPKMQLSTHTTFIEETKSFEPRHVDLRTFTLMGDQEPFVLAGGLTRTALKKGSLIVNSSQGGGSKDTWIIKK